MLATLSILCLVVVTAMVITHFAQHSSRPLAERLVDFLYLFAMRSTALAVSTDQALVAYRKEMQMMRDVHSPKYLREA